MAKTSLTGQSGMRLRVAEKTLLAFFAALFVASLTLSLPGTTLGLLAVLNVMVGCLIVALSKDDLLERSRIASPIRDWLPALLMLLAYRESGLFVRPDPAHRLDHLLILWDRTVLHSRWVEWALDACAPWLQHYLEVCYLLCYPLVPLGFAALYLMRPPIAARRQPSSRLKDLPFRAVRAPTARRPKALGRKADRDPLPACGPPSAEAAARRPPAGRSVRAGRPQGEESCESPASKARFLPVSWRIEMTRPSHADAMFDNFWTAVLLATLFCFAIYPAFPLIPPRVLFNDVPGPPVAPLLRHMNLWVLNRLSVQACLFPSAHTAAVTAMALAVRAYRPRLGILFCLAALSVAVATVYGRYHYAVDAVAGALVGVVAFAVSRRIHARDVAKTA